jgi:streptogramin lyase
MQRLLSTLLMTLSCASAVAQSIETVAGTGKPESNATEGRALAVNVGDPFGVEIGPDGALYICEVRNHRVFRLDLTSGQLTTVAGTGKKGYSGDGGRATQAELNEPYEVRFDSHGNMLFVEMQNQLVRKIDRQTSIISTVAGTGKKGFSGDGGPATKAEFSSPHSIALDAADNIYIADIGNHRIRQVDAKTGVVTSIAGNGEREQPVEGQAGPDKPMLGPRALFIDGPTMWIALREGHAVWRMDLPSKTLKHVAGRGSKGFTGDGGTAKGATLNGPKGIALGPDKCVYVADTENHAIRKIDLTSGTIITIAGLGPDQKGGAGDGVPAKAATMDRPHGICVGPDGAVYVGDTLNHRVRRIK